jgi:ribonucleoside-diphosphate reductase alpha chain
MMISQNELRVLQACYLPRDNDGTVVESPEQLFERVDRTVSEAEQLNGIASDESIGKSGFTACLRRSSSCPTHPP